MSVVVAVVVVGGGCAACIRFGALLSRQRSFFLYYCDTYLRFRGCRVVLDIELSVSARYNIPGKTCVLRARRLLLLLVAASGGVRHKFQSCMQ